MERNHPKMIRPPFYPTPETNPLRQMVDDHHIPASVIQYNQLLKACSRCRPPLAREAERLFGELMALSASEERRKFKTRDLRPTRITLKALNRCVGARRLAQLCEVGNGQWF